MNLLSYHLRNQRGAGPILVALGVAVLTGLGTGAVLYQSKELSQSGANALSGYQGDEYIRSALIYTKQLLDAQCLIEVENAWSVSPNCSSGDDWDLITDSSGDTRLRFSLCGSIDKSRLNDTGTVPNNNTCTNQQVEVKFLEAVSPQRRKVRVSTEVRGNRRLATALIGTETNFDPPPVPCTPGIVSDVLNFEEFASGARFDNSVDSQLESSHGVRFQNLIGGDFVVADVVSESNVREPTVRAWKSILCPGRGNHNRLCFDSDANRAGQKVLSLSNALNTRVIHFRVNYISNVQSLSFELADVDGGENWSIKAYNQQGDLLSGTQVTARSYGRGRSGNSALTLYSISRPTADIASIEVHGTKRIRIFGFGFDNFTTGLNVCPES